MFVCAHVYDVALCGNTVRNVALDLWLVGHHCYIKREVYTHYLNSWAFCKSFRPGCAECAQFSETTLFARMLTKEALVSAW